MGDGMDLGDIIELMSEQTRRMYDETPRDCVTCKFYEYEHDQYPCCECGVRCHYSRNMENNEASRRE